MTALTPETISQLESALEKATANPGEQSLAKTKAKWILRDLLHIHASALISAAKDCARWENGVMRAIDMAKGLCAEPPTLYNVEEHLTKLLTTPPPTALDEPLKKL